MEPSKEDDSSKKQTDEHKYTKISMIIDWISSTDEK